MSFCQAIDLLVSRGHRIDDVLHAYSLDQIEAYMIAALKNKQLEKQEAFIGIRSAFHAKGQDFKNFLSGLEIKGGRDDKPAAPKGKMTKRKISFFQKLLSGKGFK